MEQALADYAVLVTDLKIQFKATESKVVAFGGRYIVIELDKEMFWQLWSPASKAWQGV